MLRTEWSCSIRALQIRSKIRQVVGPTIIQRQVGLVLLDYLSRTECQRGKKELRDVRSDYIAGGEASEQRLRGYLATLLRPPKIRGGVEIGDGLLRAGVGAVLREWNVSQQRLPVIFDRFSRPLRARQSRRGRHRQLMRIGALEIEC